MEDAVLLQAHAGRSIAGPRLLAAALCLCAGAEAAMLTTDTMDTVDTAAAQAGAAGENAAGLAESPGAGLLRRSIAAELRRLLPEALERLLHDLRKPAAVAPAESAAQAEGRTGEPDAGAGDASVESDLPAAFYDDAAETLAKCRKVWDENGLGEFDVIDVLVCGPTNNGGLESMAQLSVTVPRGALVGVVSAMGAMLDRLGPQWPAAALELVEGDDDDAGTSQTNEAAGGDAPDISHLVNAAGLRILAEHRQNAAALYGVGRESMALCVAVLSDDSPAHCVLRDVYAVQAVTAEPHAIERAVLAVDELARRLDPQATAAGVTRV
jgi:hypothetical protein